MKGSEENDQYYHAEPAAGVYLHQGQGSREAVQADQEGKHEGQTAEGKERGKMNEIPEMITIRQCSEKTGLSYDFIRKLCLQKRIVFIRVGSKYLVNFGKFIDFLNGQEAEDAAR